MALGSHSWCCVWPPCPSGAPARPSHFPAVLRGSGAGGVASLTGLVGSDQALDASRPCHPCLAVSIQSPARPSQAPGRHSAGLGLCRTWASRMWSEQRRRGVRWKVGGWPGPRVLPGKAPATRTFPLKDNGRVESGMGWTCDPGREAGVAPHGVAQLLGPGPLTWGASQAEGPRGGAQGLRHPGWGGDLSCFMSWL